MSKGVIIALDIEARGQGAIRHGILSIGVCVGAVEKEYVFEKTRFDILPLPNQRLEDRCKETFWDKHPAILKALTKNALPANIQMVGFREIIDRYDRMFPSKVYIVCDNPGFDFGMINTYLDQFDIPTLNYTYDGQYRNTHDADSYARGLMHYDATKQWMSNADLAKYIDATDIDLDAHDHMPENDAQVIYKLHRRALVARILPGLTCAQFIMCIVAGFVLGIYVKVLYT